MKRPRPLLASILLVATGATAHAQEPPPLETIRNYHVVTDRLASAGQIGYEQIPLLREQGYEVVVNLATADARQNAEEGFRVTQTGLTYVQIPVVWQAPTLEDVEMFFDVMDANRDRKVFVHCIANMRASAFIYMYRTLVEGVPEPEARAKMNEIWDPTGTAQWAELIERVMERRGGVR